MSRKSENIYPPGESSFIFDDDPGADAAASSADTYTAKMKKRYGLSRRTAVIAAMGVLTALLIPLFTILPIGVMTNDFAKHGIAGYFDAFGSNLQAFSDWICGTGMVTGISVVFWQTLVLAFVGAALALNGAVYQGAMKNALASPSTLGVMSGGLLGSTVYALTHSSSAAEITGGFIRASELQERLAAMSVPDYLIAVYGRSLYSIVGCVAVVSLVLLLSHLAGRNGISKVALVIAGQVFTAIIASVVTAIKYWVLYNGSEAQFWAVQYLQGGSVTFVVGLADALLALVPLTICFVVIVFLRLRLNLLAFDDDVSKASGMKPVRTRNFAIMLCTVSTGIVVSFCGTIAYVGFLIPHIARRIVGPDFRFLIPASMFLGAVYVMLANHIMNFTGILPGSIGTFTSFIGIIAFIAIAVVQRARGNVDWI